MKQIPLTQGKVALVDDGDFRRLKDFNWSAERTEFGNWYAKRGLPGTRTLKRFRRMHVDVLGVRNGFTPEHKNRNGLDNRRSNLRWATSQQNAANKPPRSKSGYKGVSRQSNSYTFKARITVNYKEVHLGTFRSSVEAARAYNAAARHFFGEFAWLNPV